MTGKCVFPGIMVGNTPADLLNAPISHLASACYSISSCCWILSIGSCHLTIVHFRTTVIVRKWRNRGDKTPLREEASTSGGVASHLCAFQLAAILNRRRVVPPGCLFGFLHIMICCYYILCCPFTGEAVVAPTSRVGDIYADAGD